MIKEKKENAFYERVNSEYMNMKLANLNVPLNYTSYSIRIHTKRIKFDSS